MQSRAKIFLGLQPNKRILKELASHFHTNIALRSLPIQSEILGKATGKQTPGRDAKLVSCILIYAAILLKSLTRGAQALQWAAAPRRDRGAQQSSYNSLASPTGKTARSSVLPQQQHGVLTDSTFPVTGWGSSPQRKGARVHFEPAFPGLFDVERWVHSKSSYCPYQKLQPTYLSSSLGSCLQWGTLTRFCLGWTPSLTGKFPFSSIVLSYSFSSPEGRNLHIPH